MTRTEKRVFLHLYKGTLAEYRSVSDEIDEKVEKDEDISFELSQYHE